jgi:predicted acyltransferase
MFLPQKLMPIKATGQKRAEALDALRGIAILMMVLSSVEPAGVCNYLPSFMYHAQVGPPRFEFTPQIAGISWVDLVFPFFLFSMGAAIPFALGRRMEKGTPWHKLAGSILLRGLLLSLFAIYVEHIRTGCVDPKYTAGMAGGAFQVFLIGTGGFLLLFPALGRLPSHWKPATRYWVKAAGWLAAIGLMFLVRYDPTISLAKKATFSLARFDIIIVILANVAIYTSFIYMLSRKNLLLRLGFLGGIMAMRLSEGSTGWVKSFQANFPIPCLGRLDFLGTLACSIFSTINSFFALSIMEYGFLTIFGTIVGDRILQWMNTPGTPQSERPSWTTGRFKGLALLLFGLTLLCLFLLKGRYVVQLVLLLIPLLTLLNYLARKPLSSLETLIHDISKWGIYMLAVGMLFEPYENGIKKDPPTMSYFFISGGLAILMLLFFTILIEVLKKKSAMRVLIDNGQNPMIAYTAGGNFIGTILVVTGIDAFMKHTLTTPWPYFGYSVVFTLLVAVTVSFCTRKKLFWRT